MHHLRRNVVAQWGSKARSIAGLSGNMLKMPLVVSQEWKKKHVYIYIWPFVEFSMEFCQYIEIKYHHLGLWKKMLMVNGASWCQKNWAAAMQGTARTIESNVGLQRLAQGHFDMWPVGGGIPSQIAGLFGRFKFELAIVRYFGLQLSLELAIVRFFGLQLSLWELTHASWGFWALLLTSNLKIWFFLQSRPVTCRCLRLPFPLLQFLSKQNANAAAC